MSRPTGSPQTPISLDIARYRRVRRFFLGVFVHFIWWDVFMALPLLRWARRPALDRWRKIAARFRELALELGGVLIKLGQFLSIRFDILPPEVIEELAGLQDEVAPVAFDRISARIASEFGRPVTQIFRWISPDPLGSASLAQAHRAQSTGGQRMVLKVLRPGIEKIVETDLHAIGQVLKWLKKYKPVRRRVDLDWLLNEFSRVTRTELDMLAEGRHAERLAHDLDDEPGVCIPQVYWDFSKPRILASEDVSAIRISDVKALEKAGVSRAEVARTLYRVYMRQVFETHFVHVDPHPGNLFVRPLETVDTPAGEKAGTQRNPLPGKTQWQGEGHPFVIAFVDFGMVAEIPQRLRQALREYAIGIGRRDARMMVAAYQHAGALLEGADIPMLEETHEALFERFWGIKVGQLRDVALSEARFFLNEYRDVILKAPFQFQADMLFVVRAVGMLAGLATRLDPDFDPWGSTIPFAERFARQELGRQGGKWLAQLDTLARLLLALPGRNRPFTGRRRARRSSRADRIRPCHTAPPAPPGAGAGAPVLDHFGLHLASCGGDLLYKRETCKYLHRLDDAGRGGLCGRRTVKSVPEKLFYLGVDSADNNSVVPAQCFNPYTNPLRGQPARFHWTN